MKRIWAEAQKNAPKPNSDNEFDAEKDGYFAGIVKAAEVICNYVEGKKGNYEKNSKDSR
jgi:hypothetical protein